MEQPPLHAWCLGLWYRAFGTSPEHGPRVLAALFGLLGLGLTVAIARRLFGRDERGVVIGLLAAVCLHLSLGWLTTSHRVVVDGPLALFVLAAVFLVIRATETSRLSSRLAWSAAACAAASLAFLSKGVIGIAFPGLFAVAYAIRIPRARPVLAFICLLGLPVLALIAGPWILLLHRQVGAEAFRELFVDNTIGRVLGETPHLGHLRPVHYYLHVFPTQFLPATLVLVGALIQRFRKPAWPEGDKRRSFDVLLIWLALGLLMLTAAGTKRGVYLVPILPAAAILCGVWLDDLLTGTRAVAGSLWGRALPWILVGSLPLIAFSPLLARSGLPGIVPAPAVAAGLAGSGAAVVGIGMLRKSRVRDALLAWFVGFVLAFVFGSFAVVPAIDRIKSMKDVSLEIGAVVPADEPIFLYRPDESTRGIVALYTDRVGTVITKERALRDTIRGRASAWVLTVDKTSQEYQLRFETVRDVVRDLALAHEVVIEDLRENGRAIRLHRLTPR